MTKAFYEIELKALLSKEQHATLKERLPRELKQINIDTIYTTRYRPGDIRVRHSKKINEIVIKEGNPTVIARREMQIPVSSKRELGFMEDILISQGFTANPPWTKHKQEFLYELKGFTYVVCLQHIENFAYILEAEILTEKNEQKKHEPNLRKIFSTLGVTPIEPKMFLQKMKEYIQT